MVEGVVVVVLMEGVEVSGVVEDGRLMRGHVYTLDRDG